LYAYSIEIIASEDLRGFYIPLKFLNIWRKR